MEFMVMLFIGFFLWSVVSTAARSQKSKQLPPPALYDPSQVPPEHRLQAAGAPGPDTSLTLARLRTRMQQEAALPVFGDSEESTSELMLDEAAGDTEVDATGAAPAEVVALETTTGMSVEARPLPGEAVSLEHEVDWDTEHERFHRKYVDGHSAGSAARHGLLDEMRDPGALRRAVLMAEILGPPRSLRK
jgi:hypothetical protein